MFKYDPSENWTMWFAQQEAGNPNQAWTTL